MKVNRWLETERSKRPRVGFFLVWCISGLWIPCWAGCLLWLLGAIICNWCGPTGDLSDKLFKFTFIERFVLLQAAFRLLWLFGEVPTLEAACGDNPELSVVGAEGLEDVLWEPKSFPPLAPAPTPLVPEEPEFPVTAFEHLKHFGSQECLLMNFRYSFFTCNDQSVSPSIRKTYLRRYLNILEDLKSNKKFDLPFRFVHSEIRR